MKQIAKMLYRHGVMEYWKTHFGVVLSSAPVGRFPVDSGSVLIIFDDGSESKHLPEEVQVHTSDTRNWVDVNSQEYDFAPDAVIESKTDYYDNIGVKGLPV